MVFVGLQASNGAFWPKMRLDLLDIILAKVQSYSFTWIYVFIIFISFHLLKIVCLKKLYANMKISGLCYLLVEWYDVED